MIFSVECVAIIPSNSIHLKHVVVFSDLNFNTESWQQKLLDDRRNWLCHRFHLGQLQSVYLLGLMYPQHSYFTATWFSFYTDFHSAGIALSNVLHSIMQGREFVMVGWRNHPYLVSEMPLLKLCLAHSIIYAYRHPYITWTSKPNYLWR